MASLRIRCTAQIHDVTSPPKAFPHDEVYAIAPSPQSIESGLAHVPIFPKPAIHFPKQTPLIPNQAARTTGALSGNQASRKLATTTTSPRNQVLGSRRRRLGKLLKREGRMLDMMSPCGLLRVGTGCLHVWVGKNVGGMTEERGSPGLAAEPTRCDAHVQEGATSCLSGRQVLHSHHHINPTCFCRD